MSTTSSTSSMKDKNCTKIVSSISWANTELILTKVAEAKSARLPLKKRRMQQALNDNVDFEPIPFQAEDVPYPSMKYPIVKC